MPERRRTQRYKSPNVQGPDSWVEFRHFTWGEVRAIQAKFGGATAESLKDNPEAAKESADMIEDMIVSHLVGWNWVGDDKEPLPLPQTRADLGSMTDNEMAFLVNTVVEMTKGQDPNSPTRKN